MALGLKNRIPRFLKSITFWSDLIEEFDVELSLLKTEFDQKKDFFNPRALDSITELRDLARFFGFIIDTSVFNDIYGSDDETIIAYLRSEVENIGFKVKSKGTKAYHDYIFDQIQETGFVYPMFYDSQGTGQLYRALNFYDSSYERVQDLVTAHDFSTAPFTDVIPLQPFAEGFETYALDNDLTLDQVSPWTLDYSLFGAGSTITKHIAAEFQAQQVFTVGSDTRLITDNYLEYLRKTLEFGRRATESAHIGVGFTAYTLDDEASFVVPTINIDTAITANWTANTRVDMNALYNYITLTGSTVDFYTQPIVANQIFTTEFFDFVNISVPANKINVETVGTGNGTNNSFSSTAGYPTISPGTVRITYTADADSKIKTIRDDGNGVLVYDVPRWDATETYVSGDFVSYRGNIYLSQQNANTGNLPNADASTYWNVNTDDYGCGTINYTTGAISLTTVLTVVPEPDLTPQSASDLELSYYTNFGFVIQDFTIYDDADQAVVTCNFPEILLTKKQYHTSFLVIVDRRP